MTIPFTMTTTRIHRVAGLTGDRTALVTTRPCRAPHHPISDAGLIGGGHVPMPGEGSLAHHGVRWLDELPEYRCHGLEGVRQPVETGVMYKPSCRIIDCLALTAIAARFLPLQAGQEASSPLRRGPRPRLAQLETCLLTSRLSVLTLMSYGHA
jgi:hypothetical protein